MTNSNDPVQGPRPPGHDSTADKLVVPLDDFEPVIVALEDVSSESDVKAGSTFSGVIRIPAWPTEEQHLDAKTTEWFLVAENARLEADPRSVGSTEHVNNEGRSVLRIPFVEGPSGGTLYFRISPIAPGQCSIDLYSLEGDSGAFDLENRPLWRRLGAMFPVFPA